MKPLVVIPARGGSKGIPQKNVKLLLNKPLINYSIEVAQEVFEDSFICVSTDDVGIKEIIETTTSLKVPFLRPEELATDHAKTEDVLLHALEFYEKKGYYADTIILLQPTSPFRKSHHILEAIKLYNKDIDMVVSVKETKSNPYYILFEENSEGYLLKSKEFEATRRQDCPKVWEFNGAIYIINVKSLRSSGIGSFKKKIKYIMNEIDSIDVDTMFDWKLCELIMNEV